MLFPRKMSCLIDAYKMLSVGFEEDNDIGWTIFSIPNQSLKMLIILLNVSQVEL